MAGGPGGSGGGLSGANKVYTFIICAFAAFGGILFGYDTGTIGGTIVMTDWLETFGSYDSSVGFYLPPPHKSLVVSILSAGTFVGALLSFPLGDLLGRKGGLIASCVIFSLGVGMQLDTHWAVFVIGRVVAGLGVGAVSCLVPMYQSEVSPKHLRGLIVGMYQLAITIGSLLASIVLNSTQARLNHSSWRIPIAVQFAWAAVLAGGMLLLPESPRFYLYKGNEAAARKSLSRLISQPTDSVAVSNEVAEIELALEAERALGTSTYVDCFKNNASRNGFRTWTGIMLQGFQQLTGINFIIYYGTSFFKSAGIGNAFIITIIISVVNTAMTLVGIQLIDRVGRRRLLIVGATGMCVCEFIIAIVGVTAGKTTDPTHINIAAQRVLIAFVCFYIAFFATSWGPVAWVVTGEIFPLAIRAKGMSLSTASNWLWNFGIGYATPYLVDPSTTGPTGVKTAHLAVKVFFIWGATCLSCIIFAYFFIPETKGLALEQIDLLYRESSVIGSNAYRAKMLSQGETYLNHDVKEDDVSEKEKHSV